MSYISKFDNTFVLARLTDIGRKNLSLGVLNFNTFRVTDEDVDYRTLGSSYDLSNQNVLKPKAFYPSLKTTVFQTPSSLSNQPVPTLSPVVISTINTSPEIGFFYSGSCSMSAGTFEFSARTTNYSLQSDTIINVDELSGTNVTNVYQSGTYGSNTYEPKFGDLMLVKMNNTEITQTQLDGVIDLNIPVPYLWYRVQNITGTLSADTLVVTVDRNLPNFLGSTPGTTAWVSFYPGWVSGSTQFDNGGNYSGGTVWNMNNVWSKPIAGINTSTYEGFGDFGSESYVGAKEYYGYTSELSGNCESVKSISVLHYSNQESCTNQVESKYGSHFYIDTTTSTVPSLKLPTLMWHREPFTGGSGTGSYIGTEFSVSANTTMKYVTMLGQNTSIGYYDLSDRTGYVVGRVFPDLQTFTIHDEELVASMSYKSNRNWTLPKLNYTILSSTDGLIDDTDVVYISYLFESTSGYTTGLHSQYYTCIDIDPEVCGDSKKDIQLTFPLSQLPYMTVTGGTGWYGDKMYLLVNKQISGTEPGPTTWVKIDVTSQITNHVSGRINPLNIENSTFILTKPLYNSGTTYNLNDYITLPLTSQPEILNFGDETFLFGNMCGYGETRKYRTIFNFTIPPQQYNTTNNPTFTDSSQNVRISGVGVYDSLGNLVAVGKTALPIEKGFGTTIYLQMAIEF